MSESTELVVAQSRVVDLRNPTTDSWTDVLEEVGDLAGRIHATEFVPASLRGSVAKTAAAVLYSRELGLPPMTGLGSVHVINGRAGISAEMMRALILQAGHELRIPESNSVQCRIKGRRRGEDEWQEFAYSFAEAQRAGDVAKNKNYQTRPADMLLARATTRLARAVFPDVIHGMRSVEELQDMGEVVDEDGVVVAGAVPVVSVPVQRQQLKKRASKAPAKAEAERPAETPAPERLSVALPEPTAPIPGEPVQDVRDVQDEPGVVDAEVVDEQPPQDDSGDDGDTVDGEVVVQESRGPRIGAAQRATIMSQFARLDVKDRDERLMWIGLLTGRPVESTNELSRDEASVLLDELGKLRDRAALERRGQQLDGGEAR